MTTATTFELENEETPLGREMFAKLLFAHKSLRHDLEAVEDLAADLADGIDGQEVRERVLELKENGPLWQLKNDCLQFCSTLHAHHTGEDFRLFPRLREINPDLSPAVSKLERDHQVVGEMLAQIEAAADRLAVRRAAESRDEMASLLAEMREHLLEHLEYEEKVAGPTIRRLVSFD